MPKDNQAVGLFVKQLNAAFGSRMSSEAKALYFEQLCKWDLAEPVWERALSLLCANEDTQRAPSIARIYEYLRQAVAEQDGKGSKVVQDLGSALRAEEIEEVKRAGIWQAVSSWEPWMVKVMVLTRGHRGSMLKRELDPLGFEAKQWAESAGADAISYARQQAYEIMVAHFAQVKAPADVILRLSAPADYDDSDIALGKRRIAQLERLQHSEAERIEMRESDLSDV
jgi:hypothetical protein